MTNANCIRVLSVDDHPLFREGVGAIINSQADMSLAGTASNGEEGIETFRALRPDVILSPRLTKVKISSTANCSSKNTRKCTAWVTRPTDR